MRNDCDALNNKGKGKDEDDEDTDRILRDDRDPAPQFAQTKLGDVHLGDNILIMNN